METTSGSALAAVDIEDTGEENDGFVHDGLLSGMRVNLGRHGPDEQDLVGWGLYLSGMRRPWN